jgi:hypothetical protein
MAAKAVAGFFYKEGSLSRQPGKKNFVATFAENFVGGAFFRQRPRQRVRRRFQEHEEKCAIRIFEPAP